MWKLGPDKTEDSDWMICCHCAAVIDVSSHGEIFLQLLSMSDDSILAA